MTIFGIDISNNNGPDIDLAQVAREGFSFVFAKVTEGDYFIDYTWPSYRDAARANGLLLAGYHYLRADCDIDAQVDLFLEHLGDAPSMLDFEENSGDLSTFWAFVHALNARGRQLNLSYIPRWYWQRIGSPDLSRVPGLIQSSYVYGTGYASELYPGDDSRFWNGFGGKAVDLLQFTDRALVAGHHIDADAFRGGLDDLRRLLGLSTPPTEGALMALTEAQQADLYHKVNEIWDQLLGPGGQGWPQLGRNAAGQHLTLVDAMAQLSSELRTGTPGATE
ncbi:glycoside hydrolase family 25 protein [Nocardia sp. CDC159]|uniref:Glycoside hydrolase family 25 protein n=1 Tax=Nocardia pulmonis TaxID=2951408 RepID=A0A9X2J020_9NOCA|nr:MULTISPECIES: glycoside hydrolase family 25 protein [Nocardia]MCM6777264.1 glycoside hydrolase family 25 protein [Nocardia pulmonis]MCM6790149.1 glycoside hydrolase family 25 protein [Nocardia sp. CDC159]